MRHMKALDTGSRISTSDRLSPLLGIQCLLYRLIRAFSWLFSDYPPPYFTHSKYLSPLSQNIPARRVSTHFAPACQLTQQHKIAHRPQSVRQPKIGRGKADPIAKEAVVLFFSYVLCWRSVFTPFRDSWCRHSKYARTRRTEIWRLPLRGGDIAASVASCYGELEGSSARAGDKVDFVSRENGSVIRDSILI